MTYFETNLCMYFVALKYNVLNTNCFNRTHTPSGLKKGVRYSQVCEYLTAQKEAVDRKNVNSLINILKGVQKPSTNYKLNNNAWVLFG